MKNIISKYSRTLIFLVSAFFLAGCQSRLSNVSVPYLTDTPTPAATSEFISTPTSTSFPLATPDVPEKMVELNTSERPLPEFIQFTGESPSSPGIYVIYSNQLKNGMSLDFTSLDGLDKGTLLVYSGEGRFSEYVSKESVFLHPSVSSECKQCKQGDYFGGYYINDNGNIVFVFSDAREDIKQNTNDSILIMSLDGQIIKQWAVSSDGLECSFSGHSKNGHWVEYQCVDNDSTSTDNEETIYVFQFNLETGEEKITNYFCFTEDPDGLSCHLSRVSNKGSLLFQCNNDDPFCISDLDKETKDCFTPTQSLLLDSEDIYRQNFSPSGDKIMFISRDLGDEEKDEEIEIIVMKTKCIWDEEYCVWTKYFDLPKYQINSFTLEVFYAWNLDETKLAWLIFPRTGEGVPRGYAGTNPAPSSAGIINLEDNSNQTVYSWLTPRTYLVSWSPDEKWWLMSDEHGLFLLSLEDSFVRRLGEETHFLGWVIIP